MDCELCPMAEADEVGVEGFTEENAKVSDLST